MRITRLTLAAVFAVLATLSTGSVAFADDVVCEQVGPGQVVCTENTVFGRRHAPSSYYLLGRSHVRYEAPPLVRRDMPSRVTDTVRRSPF